MQNHVFVNVIKGCYVRGYEEVMTSYIRRPEHKEEVFHSLGSRVNLKFQICFSIL